MKTDKYQVNNKGKIYNCRIEIRNDNDSFQPVTIIISYNGKIISILDFKVSEQNLNSAESIDILFQKCREIAYSIISLN